MPNYLIIKRNISVYKFLFINVLLCNVITIQGQNKAEKLAIKKKNQIEAEQEKEQELQHAALFKIQFDKQSKAVQKRMKKNQQLLEKYYKYQMKKNLFQRISGRKKHKRYHN